MNVVRTDPASGQERRTHIVCLHVHVTVILATILSTLRFERQESTRWNSPLLSEILVDDGSSVDMESFGFLCDLLLLLGDARSLEVLEPDRLILKMSGVPKSDQH